LSEFFSAANEPALITGVVSLLTGATASIMTLIVTNRKANLESKLELAAEKVARELLKDETWKLRSLNVFKSRLPGIDDDSLRKILIRAGAISIKIGDEEAWGLVYRNKELINIDKLEGTVKKRTIDLFFEGEQRQVQQQQKQQEQVVDTREITPELREARRIELLEQQRKDKLYEDIDSNIEGLLSTAFGLAVRIIQPGRPAGWR
jgi:hypothetical protein